MKKLVKKVLTTVCTLVLCLVCLTGCSWLEINREKYYNQIVVSVGDDMHFTKKDLVEAFSNYGVQYYQQYGLSMEESINQTISSMIDRALLRQEIEKEISLTDDDELSIKKEAIDYMLDSIGTFEDKIKKEWKIEVNVETPPATNPLRDAKKEYTPTTEYNDGVVTKVQEEKEDIFLPIALPDTLTKEYYFNFITDKKVADEAWTRYVKSLQDLAKGEGRSTVESDVIKYEQDRLIDMIRNNLYLDKFQEKYYTIDTASVLKHFREQYKSQAETYKANESLYHTAMKNASSEYLYYHVNAGTNKSYVNVKHILMNFSNNQKTDITTLNTKYGIKDDNSEEDNKRKDNPSYKMELRAIVDRTKVTFEMSEEMYKEYAQNFDFRKVEGKTNTYEAYASEVYKFVQYYADGATHREKSARFDDLIYVFNDDPGIMNSEFDYVVNLDTNVTDQMVKPFADGVRTLDEQLRDADETYGAMDMITSTYGLHIIYHDGVVENLVDDANIDNISDEQLLSILCTKTTKPDSNKTIFNYIYDKLGLAEKDEAKYNKITQEIVTSARTQLAVDNVVITYYESRYKDLFE